METSGRYSKAIKRNRSRTQHSKVRLFKNLWNTRGGRSIHYMSRVVQCRSSPHSVVSVVGAVSALRVGVPLPVVVDSLDGITAFTSPLARAMAHFKPKSGAGANASVCLSLYCRHFHCV